MATPVAAVQRVALRPEEAAAALGMSRSHFDTTVAAELRWVRRGRVRLVGVEELERWVRESSAKQAEW